LTAASFLRLKRLDGRAKAPMRIEFGPK
jgi:DNA-binding transcriptional LysR family regulator